ncbi:MAG: AsmA family protein [Candidatus Rariloculaceae bacterium]
MNSIFNLVGIVAGGIIVLVVVAMIGVSLLFDPNDYKEEIAAAVAESTGRQLTLAGDLELNVFPRLRIAIGEAELSNALGFGAAPFARIEGAGLAIGLFPLLASRIEIEEARLEGLTLNLARNAEGIDNWQDLGGGGPAEPAAPDIGDGAALDLSVGSIVIDNANINWSDASTGSDWQLADFNMDADGFGPDSAFPLSIGFSLSGDEVDVTLAASMDATLGLAENLYRLEDLQVELNGEGLAWPGGQGEIGLSFAALEADLGAETLALEDLVLEVLGLNISGTLAGSQLFGDPALAGAVAFEAFDPQDLLQILDIEIETADPDVLRNVAISAELAYDSSRMMLEELDLTLDDSRLVGQMGLVDDSMRFDLEIESINIDRYLPPAEEWAAVEEEGSLDEVDLPLESLRTLSAEGQFSINEAQFSGLTLSDVEFALSADDGLVSMQPSASLYGGSFAGDVTIEVMGDTAALSIEQQLSTIDAMPLVQDLMDAEFLTGTVSANMDLAATGANLGEVRRQLDGDVSFALADGAWEGVDVWYELRRARAVLDSGAMPEREEPARTPFSEVSASGLLTDGVLNNEDLIADLGFFTVTGAGTANLVTDAIDFDVVAAFVDGPELQSDPAMEGLAGNELPLAVTGTMSSPSVMPDFGAMIGAEVEAAAEEAIEEEREELEERLNDRLRGIFDR